MNYKILLGDNDKGFLDNLAVQIAKDGYTVIKASDGQQVLDMAFDLNPDIVVMDLILDKVDGIDVIKSIRKKIKVPIIILTEKKDEVDKVLSLELGADDYVTKPFNLRELLARIKANLRRALVYSENGKNQFIVARDLRIDLTRYEATKSGKELNLTTKEFELLKYLIINKNQIFTREQLLEKVWGYEYYGDVRTVDVTVRRLREKIEDDPSNSKYICTKRRVGYFFNDINGNN